VAAEDEDDEESDELELVDDPELDEEDDDPFESVL